MENLQVVGETKNAGEMITSLELVKQINVFRSEECNRAELRHDTLRSIIKDEFEQEILSQEILEKPISSNGGRPSMAYELTTDQAKQVLMRESKFVRKAMINYINNLEKAIKNIAIPSYQISDPIKRAEMWIEEEKQRQLLLSENTVMKPKADYFDALVDKSVNICVRDTAKEIGVKQNTFVNWLLSNKYCFRNNKGKLRPYADYSGDLFVMKEFVTANGYGDASMLITPKGRETFRLLIGSKK